MKNYKSFDLLTKFNYERLGGTAEELKAANLFVEECKKLNIDVLVEEFPIDYAEIKVAKLEVLAPEYKEYEVTGYAMTGSTPAEGIEAEMVYIGDGNDLDLQDVEGKIVAVHQRIPLKIYKKLVERNVKGFIAFSGSVYDDYSITDLEQNFLREVHYSHGKIPGVTLRARELNNLLLSNPTKVRLTLVENEGKINSRNVVATIKGTEKPNEIIAFTAHYDSVKFSTGAYDNGTGSTTIYELMAYFNENKPKRTLKFIWCGSEEKGLLGSKAYCEAHNDELKDYKLCINVDMTGVVIGFDAAFCTSEQALVNYINYLGKEVGFGIKARQSVYSSDSTPFADKGIPAVTFARLSPRGGAEIHSRKDVIDYLDSANYYETCKFIEQFSDRMVNSHTIPVNRTIPENMKEELDYYNMRKERPEK